MAQKVISFRCDDDMLTELEQRKLPDESIMLTAQRVLREALGLGVIGEQARRVEEIVDTAVQPIQQEIEQLCAKLENLERGLNNVNDGVSEHVPKLINDVWIIKQFVLDCSDPLSERVKKLEARARLELKEAMRESGEPLLERVEKLEVLISELRANMEELKKSKVRSQDDSDIPADTPQLKCPHCGAVGVLDRDFKPSGSSRGRKRYLCLSCGKKHTSVIET